jgi:hypothetical protein
MNDGRLMKIILLWLAAASALALTGVLRNAPFLVPITIFSIVTSGIIAYRTSPTLRTWVATIDARKLIALHLLRAPVGITFLIFYGYGLLPALFAVRAGIGDTIIGLLAIGALYTTSRRARLAWNVVGLVDIALSVATAFKAIILARDPVGIATMSTFPFPLIPFFLVPAVVLSHLALFTKLLRNDDVEARVLPANAHQ